MKNRIEIGDVYYCYRANGDRHKRGKSYKIISAFSNELSIETDPHPDSHFNYRYYYVDTPVSHWSKFGDHFATLKDLRKMKLEKLNEKM